MAGSRDTVTGSKLSELMKNRLNNISFLTVFPIIMLFCSFPVGANTSVESDTFPVYDSIRPNVSFWKKIYTRYSTT